MINTNRPKLTIKQILLSNQNWWRFYAKNEHKIRYSIKVCIVKLLSCKNTIRGYHEYHCSNKNCSHVKRVFHTCKSRACSSCGKKLTEEWIAWQYNILPNTPWQHITFTMPQQLWDFFWLNRQLLQSIGKIAAQCIQMISKKKNLTPAIFIAIHTFGRDLKRNVHIHLSTTAGGISDDHTKWKSLFFHQFTLMKIWRYAIIKLFRQAYHQHNLIIPESIKRQLNPAFTFDHFLNSLYLKHWVVHCAKPTSNYKANINYLGRYIKRPAIAESKLRHYDGNEVTFRHLDHLSKTYKNFSLSVDDFIARFIQHIPDTGFRMIRYYGFLANRVRGKLLPKVYSLLRQLPPKTLAIPTHAQLILQNFGFNPLSCILCGSQLLLTAIRFPLYSTLQLIGFHRELALCKKI